MKVSYINGFAVAAMLALAGCGGGGGGSGSESVAGSSTGTATYVDSAVAGVGYRCGSEEGVTDREGTFRFEKGKGCTFRLGPVEIRSLEPNRLVDGGIVAETDPKVAALLQSLDRDGDASNGIEIADAVVKELTAHGFAKIPETEEELEALVEGVKGALPQEFRLRPVSYAQATAHIQETVAEILESPDARYLKMTDEDAFNQTASGPVMYSIPVMAKELDPAQYGLEPLSDAEFNALSDARKYRVATKLYGTLFYGVDYDQLVNAVGSGRFMSRALALFNRPNTPSEIAGVEERMHYYEKGGYGDAKLSGVMLARLYHLQPGRAYVNRWAAYILTQSILFSPAYELDTVYTVDAIDVYGDLVRDFDSGFSMQWVTFTHMMTDENWRRFRSPEDNGREMLEIYTMDFEDDHVPLAGKALKNWKLDRRSNTLVVCLDENTEPITGLFPGWTIRNGTDFYSALVLQPSFVSTVARRLVEIYFPEAGEARKSLIVSKIASSGPRTFTGLLKQIVFSREYLLHSSKTRSFEESFYPIAKSLGWLPKKNSFYYLARNLDNMHQSTMRYKLGRKTTVPLDSQSFGWFHKTIRERVMLDYETNASLESGDAGWPLYELVGELPQELIGADELDERNRRQESWYVNERRRAAYVLDRLFLPIAGRLPHPEEKEALIDMIDDEKYDERRFDNLRWIDLYGNSTEEYDRKERGYFAQMVLNYMSRLSDIYRFEAVK